MSNQPSKVLDKQRLKNMSLDIIKAVETTVPQMSTKEGDDIMTEVSRMTGLMLMWVYEQSEKKLINQ